MNVIEAYSSFIGLVSHFVHSGCLKMEKVWASSNTAYLLQHFRFKEKISNVRIPHANFLCKPKK